MARRNPSGGLLFLGALVAGGLWWLSKKKEPASAIPEPQPWPGEEVTGWAVGELCTNADLMDPDAALDHAELWHEAQRSPPMPVSDNATDIMEMADTIRDAIDDYFEGNFPGCESGAPGSILHGQIVSSPDELAEQTASMLHGLQGGGAVSGTQLTAWAATLVGH